MFRTLSSRLKSAVVEQQRSGRYRFLEPNSAAQDREITIADQTLVNFCSNDYLGFANHPAIKLAATKAISEYGVGSGAAQLLSGRHECHESLEATLVEYTGYEAALIYSSGYLANLGLVTALVSRHDTVHQDKLNHASIIDAVRLSGAKSKRYAHVDTASLRTNLERTAGAQQWIITDSVFSMDGDIAPVPKIVKLAAAHNATAIIDDAHGFGTIGSGRGVAKHFNLDPKALPIVVVTFGKALGTQGAAVLGSRELISFLIQSSRTFIYDTAMPPAIAAATERAIELISSDKSHIAALESNISLFRKLSLHAGLPLTKSETPIQPIILGDEPITMRAAAHLRKAGLYVRAVRPPTVPHGRSRLRVCLTSSHTRHDIERLVLGLEKFFADEN
ncbi:MAG: 8-amino-7-oxononanoate synthase [Gammaproteobacteria bacterium]